MIHALKSRHVAAGLLLLLAFLDGASAQATEEPAWLPALLEKEEITIVLTDSGLGGLSVVAVNAKEKRQVALLNDFSVNTETPGTF